MVAKLTIDLIPGHNCKGGPLWPPVVKCADHVTRNDKDVQENLSYITFNPVRAGFVTQPYFYPYTGFLLDCDDVPPRSNKLHLGNSFVKTC